MTEVRKDIMTGADDEIYRLSTRPDWLRKRLDWFMDQRLGLIIHWAPYSQWDCLESWPLVPADTWARPDSCPQWIERHRDLDHFSKDYWKLNRTFNPTRFDADQWAQLAADAGAKYVAYTTKHHDGFCMFDTKTTDYRITHPDCPFHLDPRADTVKQVFNAFRKQGMAISCYYSKSDWHCPWYWTPQGSKDRDRHPNYNTAEQPEVWEQFVQFVHRQIEELMSQYGEIDLLWLDGGQVRPPDQDIRMGEIAQIARRYNPGLIMVDRTVGGAYEDLLTPEQKIPDVPLPGPWESCITLGESWKYITTDQPKPTGDILRKLIEIVSKGGNLLLGVGPSPSGEIPEVMAARLRDIGDWLKVNGEAIYGSRPFAPYAFGPVRFTQKQGDVYAMVLPDETGRFPDKISLPLIPPQSAGQAVILGAVAPGDWKRYENVGCDVALRNSTSSLPITLKFSGAAKWQVAEVPARDHASGTV